MGRMMVAASVPLVGLGYYSIKSAATFQQAMTQIQTQAGASQTEVTKMSKSILDMSQSMQYAQGPEELAKGLYHLESVGMRGPKALNALKIAAQGAAVGNQNLEDVTTALAGAWTTHIKGAGDFNHIMGILNATVGIGNMRMGDLTQALGMGMLPAFKNAGLSIQDAMGALAVFTDAGYKAGSAAAQVSTALHFLNHPTTKAQRAFLDLGMSTTQMATDMMHPHGLLVAMKDLRKHLMALPGGLHGIQAQTDLGSILPGGRGRIMLTLINNLGRYQKKLKDLGVDTGKLNSDIAKTHQTAMFKLKAAWASVQASMVKVGATLLPIVGQILPKLVSIITKVANWFEHLSKSTKKFIVIATMVLAVGGGLLILFGSIASAIGSIIAIVEAMSLSLDAVPWVAGFLALIAVLYLVVTHFGTVKRVAGDVAHWVVNAWQNVEKFFTGLWNSIKTGAEDAFKFIKKIFNYAVNNTPLGMGLKAFKTVTSVGGNLLHGHIGRAASSLVHGAGSVLHAATFGLLGSTGGVVTPNGVRRYQMGGPVGTDTIPGWLTPGEGIVNRAAMAQIGSHGLAQLNAGGGLSDMTIQPGPAYLIVDGRTLARTMVQYTLQRAARGPSTLVGGSMMAANAQTGP